MRSTIQSIHPIQAINSQDDCPTKVITHGIAERKENEEKKKYYH